MGQPTNFRLQIVKEIVKDRALVRWNVLADEIGADGKTETKILDTKLAFDVATAKRECKRVWGALPIAK